MGRPVISANLCVSQGAFETSRANGRSFLYKGKQQSFKRAFFFFKKEFLHQSREFQIPFRGVTRHMAGSCWKPLPQHWQDVTAAEANQILFACGSKRHGSKLSKTASLSVCREKALQCTMLGNRDLSAFHLLLSLPAELLPSPKNILQFYL